MDRGAWWATVHGVTGSWTRLKQLSTHAKVNQANMQTVLSESLTWFSVLTHSNSKPFKFQNFPSSASLWLQPGVSVGTEVTEHSVRVKDLPSERFLWYPAQSCLALTSDRWS